MSTNCSARSRPLPLGSFKSCPAFAFAMLIVTLFMVQRTCAQVMEFDPSIFESPLFQEFAARGEIHVDTRQRPAIPERWDLQRRQVGDSVVPTTVAEATSTLDSATTTTTGAAEVTSPISTDTKSPLAPAGVSTSTAPSVTVVTTPLPTPFDTSLGSNFTSASCPAFFQSFLGNATFQSCVAVSMLLQNSNSFFRAERSTTLLTQTLDAACNAPVAICGPLLYQLAADLIAPANCGADYHQQNPLVAQAYAGMVAYEPVYRATCLRDQTTNNYCFSQAIFNNSGGGDFYPYYTALGLQMPTTARPSCTQCLKDTMEIFAGYVGNGAQPLAGTYLPCARQVDDTCGAGFVSSDVQAAAVTNPNGGSSRAAPSPWTAALASTLVLAATAWTGLS